MLPDCAPHGGMPQFLICNYMFYNGLLTTSAAGSNLATGSPPGTAARQTLEIIILKDREMNAIVGGSTSRIPLLLRPRDAGSMQVRRDLRLVMLRARQHETQHIVGRRSIFLNLGRLLLVALLTR
jgi:hypothetical protein